MKKLLLIGLFVLCGCSDPPNYPPQFALRDIVHVNTSHQDPDGYNRQVGIVVGTSYISQPSERFYPKVEWTYHVLCTDKIIQVKEHMLIKLSRIDQADLEKIEDMVGKEKTPEKMEIGE